MPNKFFDWCRRIFRRKPVMVNLMDGNPAISNMAKITFPLAEFMEIVRNHWDRHSVGPNGEPIDMNYYFELQSATLKRTVNIDCKLARVDVVLKGKISYD